MQPVAEGAIEEIIDILTRPLTPEEANPPKPKKADIGPAEYSITGETYSEALEKFNEFFLENNMGDGLPR